MKIEKENEIQVGRHRFPKSNRSIWKDEPDSNWNDWQWQIKNMVKDLDTLDKILHMSEDEKEVFRASSELFHVGITPYYASLMDPSDPECPVRKQAVPQAGELKIFPEDMDDPLAEDKDMPVPCLTHRYPDRVLLYSTPHCAMYCRHCTRKRKVAQPSSTMMEQHLEAAFNYIEQHKEVRDIIVSGGDPLAYSDDKLEYILKKLYAIPHVEIVRLGTRNPVTRPQRITDSLVKMLQQFEPLYINTHFNHPNECTYEAYQACKKLADAGFILGNQTVLLKGVNDDPAVMKELVHKLLAMRVRPYYIYQCDLSKGINHFRTTVDKGLEIIENLRGHTSGLAVPHYVIDAPGGGGKIPLLPTYLVKKEGREVHLRNYKKSETYVYIEPES
jgi:lysine 2,3-aminomutase